jgi:hypothetical protein
MEWLAKLIHAFILQSKHFFIRHSKTVKRVVALGSTIGAIYKVVPFLLHTPPEDVGPRLLQIATEALPHLAQFLVVCLAIYFFLMYMFERHERKMLQLRFEGKGDVARDFLAIRKALPNNHYLGLVVGRMRDEALEVKERRGTDILDAINKNIKKNERVYWITSRDIGIIMYEVHNKEFEFFLKVIFKKLVYEIGNAEDTRKFLGNIEFLMIDITVKPGDLLEAEQIALNRIHRGGGELKPKLADAVVSEYQAEIARKALQAAA